MRLNANSRNEFYVAITSKADRTIRFLVRGQLKPEWLACLIECVTVHLAVHSFFFDPCLFLFQKSDSDVHNAFNALSDHVHLTSLHSIGSSIRWATGEHRYNCAAIDRSLFSYPRDIHHFVNDTNNKSSFYRIFNNYHNHPQFCHEASGDDDVSCFYTHAPCSVRIHPSDEQTCFHNGVVFFDIVLSFEFNHFFNRLYSAKSSAITKNKI